MWVVWVVSATLLLCLSGLQLPAGAPLAAHAACAAALFPGPLMLWLMLRRQHIYLRRRTVLLAGLKVWRCALHHLVLKQVRQSHATVGPWDVCLGAAQLDAAWRLPLRAPALRPREGSALLTAAWTTPWGCCRWTMLHFPRHTRRQEESGTPCWCRWDPQNAASCTEGPG